MKKNNLEKYEQLLLERPHLFENNEVIKIVTDLEFLKNYEKETGISLGVMYESKYRYMLVDLIDKGNGTYYTYERLVSVREGDAVVIVPIFQGKFVFLKQFRHALRDYQLAFVRGFGEGLPPEENAKKEVYEELGAGIISIRHIGNIVPDSGLGGTSVHIFVAEIEEPHISHHEGITDILLLSPQETKQMIASGNITDGFSLSALTLLENQKEKDAYGY